MARTALAISESHAESQFDGPELDDPDDQPEYFSEKDEVSAEGADAAISEPQGSAILEYADPDEDVAEDEDESRVKVEPAEQIDWLRYLPPFILAGALLGLLPMWNGAVFAGAAAVMALMLALLPLRREMIAIAAASAIFALPQVLFLKTGMLKPTEYSMFHWGYTIDDPTFYKVAYYLAFTFGFKWILIGIALGFCTKLQRLMMAAFTGLVIMALCFQFSEELLTNHKFFNIWLVLMNLPVAFGLVKLWNLFSGAKAFVGKLAAIILGFLVIVGGVIDLYPIKNGYSVEYKYTGDRLVEWVKDNTDPKAIFLSHRYVNHGILLAGRRLFYGHPYYAWGAGYPTSERDQVYKKMFESQDPAEVLRLLHENRISYVAIDNAVRRGDFIKNPNEALMQAYFETVFVDTDNKYDNLKIYAVPDVLGTPNPSIPLPVASPTPTPAPKTAFDGGEGSGPGEFKRPRGIVSDSKGDFYVADTGNGRVQKFDAAGKFLASYGKAGPGEGELGEPNGVAIDNAGNIFVTDSLNHKLVKLGPDGTFIKEWKGPEPGFYGPRDIEFGPNKKLYIVDQGRTRIVVFDPVGDTFTTFGGPGGGEGQFLESTGITIGDNMVFVADLGNNRIQVFDLDGKFIRLWEVPPWERYVWHYPDIAYDDQTKRLYVTNGWKKEILLFDVNGNPVEDTIRPEGQIEMNNPSSIDIAGTGKTRHILVVNTGSNKISQFELEPLSAK